MAAQMPDGRSLVQGIMDQVRSENPSFWPYGCSVGQHDDVYLLKDAGVPVGWVGWQVFSENGKRAGYYSIGILPEHRGKGYAKEAVGKLLRLKSASVDEVKAYIMPHNAASIGLAKSLDIPIVHKVASICASGVYETKVASSLIRNLASRVSKIPAVSREINNLPRMAAGAGAMGAHTALGNAITGYDPATAGDAATQYGLAMALGAIGGRHGTLRRFLRTNDGRPRLFRGMGLSTMGYTAPTAASALMRPFFETTDDYLGKYEGKVDEELASSLRERRGAKTPGLESVAAGDLAAQLKDKVVGPAATEGVDRLKDKLPGLANQARDTTVEVGKKALPYLLSGALVPAGAAALGGSIFSQLGRAFYRNKPELSEEENDRRLVSQRRLRNALFLLGGGAAGVAAHQAGLAAPVGEWADKTFLKQNNWRNVGRMALGAGAMMGVGKGMKEVLPGEGDEWNSSIDRGYYTKLSILGALLANRGSLNRLINPRLTSDSGRALSRDLMTSPGQRLARQVVRGAGVATVPLVPYAVGAASHKINPTDESWSKRLMDQWDKSKAEHGGSAWGAVADHVGTTVADKVRPTVTSATNNAVEALTTATGDVLNTAGEIGKKHAPAYGAFSATPMGVGLAGGLLGYRAGGLLFNERPNMTRDQRRRAAENRARAQLIRSSVAGSGAGFLAHRYQLGDRLMKALSK